MRLVLVAAVAGRARRGAHARRDQIAWGHARWSAGTSPTVQPAGEAEGTIEWVHRIIEQERGFTIGSRPLEATEFEVDGTRWAYVFYENGLSVNVLYGPDEKAVGFKLSDGMAVPAELEPRLKFVRQKSKLAGTIRGSYFVIKGDY